MTLFILNTLHFLYIGGQIWRQKGEVKSERVSYTAFIYYCKAVRLDLVCCVHYVGTIALLLGTNGHILSSISNTDAAPLAKLSSGWVGFEWMVLSSSFGSPRVLSLTRDSAGHSNMI